MKIPAALLLFLGPFLAGCHGVGQTIAADDATDAGDRGLPPVTRPPPMPLCAADAPRAPRPALLSPEFERGCGGCHGRLAQGSQDGAFPPLPGARATFADFRAALASPAHAASTGAVPDDVLRRDFDLLQSTAPAARAAAAQPRVPTPPPAPRLTAQQIAAAYADGLPVWRRRGRRGSCAGCHAPDAMDLARMGYADSDVLRWAVTQGLSAADGGKIVALVQAARANAGATDACDPDQPFLRPGGDRLPGTDRPQRDTALADELRAGGADLAGADIRGVDDARRLIAQLLALDLYRVRVGFDLPRWAEDAFDGRASVADWLPDWPRDPSPGHEAAWWALHDRYIATPSPENLWAIHDAVGALTATPDAPVAGWMRDRYRAVLLAQHLMRVNRAQLPPIYSDAERALLRKRQNDARSQQLRDRFPFWDVGAGADGLQDHATLADFPGLALAAATDAAIRADVARVAVPFYWLAMAGDPAFQLTHGGFAYPAGFVDHLLPLIGQEMVVHKLVLEVLMGVFAMEGIDTSLPLQRTGGSYITSPVNGRWAAGNARPWRFVDGLPPDDATGGYFYVKETYPADERQQQSAVHQRIRLSYLRLTLFMTIDALARTKQHRNLDPQQVMHLRAYLLRWGPAEQRAAIDAAAAQALALLAAARNVGN